MVCEQLRLGGVHLTVPPCNADNATPNPTQSVTGSGQGGGEVGLMNSLMQLGHEEVSGSRGSGGGDETVVGGEIGPVDLLPQPNLGISGDPESSEGT